jgi:hypothetical protein
MHYDIEEIFGAGANLQLHFSFLEWLHICEQGKLHKLLLVLRQRKTLDKFVSESPDLRPTRAEFSQDFPASSIHIGGKEQLPSSSTSQKNKEIPLVTETLAKVYHQQKKYHLALEAYRQLRLEYPEKSSYFARLIKEIKAERV